jgi:excisionase family DNA binding protein
MSNLILSSLPLEQLKTEISEAVLMQIAPYLPSAHSKPQPTELLTRKEAAKLLGVSLVTLNQWTRDGRVKGYHISSRVRYKREELENSLTRIKTRR